MDDSLSPMVQQGCHFLRFAFYTQSFLAYIQLYFLEVGVKTFLNPDQINSIIRSNEADLLIKEYGLQDIADSLLSNNIQISIESRDEKFLFVYNKNDEDATNQLLNLFKYMYDRENLDFLNDRISKDLRYFKIPINVMRIMIKFREYLKLF